MIAPANPGRPEAAVIVEDRMTAITVTCWPEEETRTTNSACIWVAEATVGGQTYTARSRHGVANELARQRAHRRLAAERSMRRGGWIAVARNGLCNAALLPVLDSSSLPDPLRIGMLNKIQQYQ